MNNAPKSSRSPFFRSLSASTVWAADIYAFPHAGGSAYGFRNFSGRLGPDTQVWAAQLPGREARWQEPLPSNLEEIVGPASEWIEAHADRPLLLLGVSFGAHVAFHVAKRLDGLNHLKALAVLSSRPPHLRSTSAPLHTLPEDEFVRRLGALGGLNEAITTNREVMEFTLPAIRADVAIYETYKEDNIGALGCPILAAGGIDDASVPSDTLTAWKERTTSGFSLLQLDGGHFLMEQPNPHLIRSIRNLLGLP